MTDPMAMYRATMALQAQAAGWLESYKGWLREQGLGFTAEDLAAIEAARSAPPPTPSMADAQAAAADVQAKVASTVFPEDGIPPEDPRLVVAGIPLVALAIMAVAIGWADDEALTARVAAALGYTADQHAAAGAAFAELATTDMVVATFYGQLFSQVGELPRR